MVRDNDVSQQAIIRTSSTRARGRNNFSAKLGNLGLEQTNVVRGCLVLLGLVDFCLNGSNLLVVSRHGGSKLVKSRLLKSSCSKFRLLLIEKNRLG